MVEPVSTTIAAVGVVAALVTGFKDAKALYKDWKRRRKLKKAQQKSKNQVEKPAEAQPEDHSETQIKSVPEAPESCHRKKAVSSKELAKVLDEGIESTESEYEKGLNAHGPRFNRGDDLARRAVTKILTNMNESLIHALLRATETDDVIDIPILRDVAKKAQVAAVDTICGLIDRLHTQVSKLSVDLPWLSSPQRTCKCRNCSYEPSDGHYECINDTMPLIRPVIEEAETTGDPPTEYTSLWRIRDFDSRMSLVSNRTGLDTACSSPTPSQATAVYPLRSSSTRSTLSSSTMSSNESVSWRPYV